MFGVYKITNIVNSKFYIGSTTRSFAIRWRQWRYELKKKIARSTYLQRAWLKYGSENFRFEVFEVVEDKSLVLEREQYWIDTLKPEYNICDTAGSPYQGVVPWNKGKRQQRLCTCGKPVKELFDPEGKFKKYMRTCGANVCQHARSVAIRTTSPGPRVGMKNSEEHRRNISLGFQRRRERLAQEE